jgi:hypothetical protein
MKLEVNEQREFWAFLNWLSWFYSMTIQNTQFLIFMMALDLIQCDAWPY